MACTARQDADREAKATADQGEHKHEGTSMVIEKVLRSGQCNHVCEPTVTLPANALPPKLTCIISLHSVTLQATR